MRPTVVVVTIDRTGSYPPEHQAAVRAEAELGAFPRIGDGIHRTINLAESYASLAAVAMARAAFYGVLLERQFTDADQGDGEDGAGGDPTDGPEGTRGLIGFTGTAVPLGAGQHAEARFVPTGEARRALVDLERDERREAARLIESAYKIGVKLDQIEVMRSYAGTISAALKAFAAETGLVLTDSDVVNAAKRAALTARRQLGYDDGDPTAAFGRAMGARQRVRVLEAALEAAKREAGEA